MDHVGIDLGKDQSQICILTDMGELNRGPPDCGPDDDGGTGHHR